MTARNHETDRASWFASRARYAQRQRARVLQDHATYRNLDARARMAEHAEPGEPLTPEAMRLCVQAMTYLEAVTIARTPAARLDGAPYPEGYDR